MWGTPIGLGDPDFAFSATRSGVTTSAAANTTVSTRTKSTIRPTLSRSRSETRKNWCCSTDAGSTSRTATTIRRTSWRTETRSGPTSTVEAVGDEHHHDDQWMLHSVPITADGSGVLTVSWGEPSTRDSRWVAGTSMTSVSTRRPSGAQRDPGDESGKWYRHGTLRGSHSSAVERSSARLLDAPAGPVQVEDNSGGSPCSSVD